MSAPPPPFESRWKPGKSPNPGGVPAIPPALRNIKQLKLPELSRLFAKWCRMPSGEITRLMNDKAERDKIPAIELAFIGILARAYNTGEHTGLAWLMDRIMGKAPIATLESEAGGEDLAKLPMPELVARAEALLPELKKVGG